MFDSTAIRDVETTYYEYRNDGHMTDKAYKTKYLVHFEPIDSGCDVQHDHANDHTYAVEKQIVGFHVNRATVHGRRH